MPKRPKQLTKTASRREIALPGASMKRIREAFLRPVDVRRKPRKK